MRTLVPAAVLFGIVAAGTAAAQDAPTAVSACEAVTPASALYAEAPLDSAAVAIGESTVQVCYRSVAARGRPVFGYSTTYDGPVSLVAYDTLWNSSVLLEVPVAMEIAGIAVTPGSYGIYAVPSSTDWMIALSSDVPGFLGRTGTQHDSEVGRAMVRAGSASGYAERLTVSGEPSGPTSGTLVLGWERSEVRIPMRVGVAAPVCAFRGTPEQAAGRPSPFDSVLVQTGGQTAKICYGRPSARERTVFGGLVPYDDAWRTGANEPTIVHLPFAASIAGIAVDAGSYAILTVPSPNAWVVIVNASTSQWGRVETTAAGARSQYSDAVRGREVGRALVSSGATDGFVEIFTITGQETGPATSDLVLEWENTRVRIPIANRGG